MNWKKISENWEKFTQMNNLEVEKDDRNYLYGKQEIYQAKENFNGFEIFYENKLNKSTEYGSSFNLGHKMMLVVPIEPNQKLEVKINRNSFWNRFTKRNQNLRIITNGAETKNLFPITEIENLMKSLPDLEISIKSFNFKQNPNIQYGQKVVSIESKHCPTELNELELSRIIMTKILTELLNKNIVKASSQHRV